MAGGRLPAGAGRQPASMGTADCSGGLCGAAMGAEQVGQGHAQGVGELAEAVGVEPLRAAFDGGDEVAGHARVGGELVLGEFLPYPLGANAFADHPTERGFLVRGRGP